MQDNNPFAPPQAQVLDADADRVQAMRVFSYKGRMGRLRYIAYGVATNLLVSIALIPLTIAFASKGLTAGWITALTWIPLVILYSMWTVQRSHDMNWSGWASLGVLIPFVNFLWVFKRGTDGENNYGHPPPPNTLGVKLLSWILPLIAIVGVVAAIALPAYQDYTKRAKAAQGQTAPIQAPSN